QLGVHHRHRQSGRVPPSGEERHEPSTLPRPIVGRALPGTREPPTDQLARSLPLIGLVDIRHRVGDMRFGDALLPVLTLECAPRAAPATTPTPHPFVRGICVVVDYPGTGAIHGILYCLCTAC